MMLMRMKQSYIVIKLNLDITKIGGNFYGKTTIKWR